MKNLLSRKYLKLISLKNGFWMYLACGVFLKEIVLLFVFVSLASNLSAQDLFLGEGSSMVISSGSTLTLSGNLINNNSNGIQGGGELVFASNEVQYISGSNIDLPAVSIENASLVSSSVNINVTGNLNIGATKLILEDDKYLDLNTYSIIRTTGFINGALERTFNTSNATRAFEIGRGNYYMPITISYSAVSTDFSLRVFMDSIATDPFPSAISPTKFHKSKLVLTPGVGAPLSYGLVVDAPSQLLVGGATHTNLKLAVNNGSWSSAVNSSTVNSSIVSFPLSTYGLMQIGELNALQVSLQVLLEGMYVGSGTMNPALFNSGVSGNASLCDSLILELRSASAPYSLVSAKSSVVSNVGLVTFLFDGVTSGNYYLVVKHRNHLSTWSSIAVACSTSTIYDFTNAANKAYGSNLKELADGKFALFAGDVNQDGIIDPSDFTNVDNDNFNYVSGYFITDITGDGLTDPSDFTSIDNNNFNYIGVVAP